jgi:regulatory protein
MLKSRDSHAEARRCALRLLHYRCRSKKEMLEKLRLKGFNDEQVNNTIAFLENAGLIKDETLAAELLRNAVARRYLGRKGVAMFLSKRGIDRDLISETLSNLTQEMETETARKLVEKKLKTMKNYPENTVKRRLCGILQRRGFSSDIIYKAVKTL